MTEPKRGRGRPRKHPSWTDADGVSRALRDHPNYSVCKNFQRDAKDPPDPMQRYGKHHGEAEHFLLVDRWKEDIATFTYGLTTEIGMRPSRFHLIWPTDPRRPVGPGNVTWFERPRDGVREARRRQIASLEAKEAIAELLAEADLRQQPDGSYLPGAVVRRLKHMPSCESSWLDPVECPCTDFVRDHFATF